MGGAFNGQNGRKHIFADIVAVAPISAIVETGTYRGTTTAFFAETGLPVFSIEGVPRNYGFARAHLARYQNVHLFLCDSRVQLSELLHGNLSSIRNEVIFFYLDAHWNPDLPLAEELDIIFQNCPQAIVMLDDFEVPNDTGYGFDDYGPSKALTFGYINNTVRRFDLVVFYPNMPSIEETGMKRGSVILTTQKIADDFLLKICSLRKAEA